MCLRERGERKHYGVVYRNDYLISLYKIYLPVRHVLRMLMRLLRRWCKSCKQSRIINRTSTKVLDPFCPKPLADTAFPLLMHQTWSLLLQYLCIKPDSRGCIIVSLLSICLSSVNHLWINHLWIIYGSIISGSIISGMCSGNRRERPA